MDPELEALARCFFWEQCWLSSHGWSIVIAAEVNINSVMFHMTLACIEIAMLDFKSYEALELKSMNVI